MFWLNTGKAWYLDCYVCSVPHVHAAKPQTFRRFSPCIDKQHFNALLVERVHITRQSKLWVCSFQLINCPLQSSTPSTGSDVQALRWAQQHEAWHAWDDAITPFLCQAGAAVYASNHPFTGRMTPAVLHLSVMFCARTKIEHCKRLLTQLIGGKEQVS